MISRLSQITRRTYFAVFGFIIIGSAILAPRVEAIHDVIFNTFGITTSQWKVNFIGRIPTTDLDGVGGVPCWAQWCYRIEALENTTTGPGEFTHVSFGVPNIAPFNTVEAIIGSNMSVVPDPGPIFYTKQFRAGGGPLGMRGAEFNNQDDLLVMKGEEGVFCYSAPDATVVSVQIGMKVGGDKRFSTIEGPGTLLCPIPMIQPPALMGLILVLLAIGGWELGLFRRSMWS